jgi:hypothetical protein
MSEIKVSNKKLKIGIVGGTGYTGVELLRLLSVHPNVSLTAITSRGDAGLAVADMFPSLRGYVDLCFSDPAQANLDQCDVVFFATPHGVAMSQAQALLEAKVCKTRRCLNTGTRCHTAAQPYLKKRCMACRSCTGKKLSQPTS